MNRDNPQSFGILLSALGGEGGGVLADWITATLRNAGYLAQGTSIPGVAQRTGQTTYYIETCLIPERDFGDRKPVFALTPMPGHVDLFVGSELVEAARAAQNGFATADRTTLITSTHRVFAIGEKMHMGDGRFDAGATREVCEASSRRAILFDMEAATTRAGAVISAIMFGAVAGSGALPIDAEVFKDVIRASGKMVEANLRGFELGYAAAEGKDIADTGASVPVPSAPGGELGRLIAETSETWPAALADILPEALRRLHGYHGIGHARDYLQRLAPVRDLDGEIGGDDKDWELSRETARYLALRMTYEDVIRVADLKTRPERYNRIRMETGAAPDEPVHITEHLKPGPEEFCAVLPNALGAWLLGWVRRKGLEDRLHVGLHIRSDTITGYLTLRAMARMRFLRKRSWRWRMEMENIDRWLDLTQKAARVDYGFGVEVAECANLIKGYGSTWRRGIGSFDCIMSVLVEPAIAAGRAAGADVAEARKAALADPDGKALAATLGPPPRAAEPLPAAAE